jgi:hypothetical protein
MSVKQAEWDQLVRLVRRELQAQPALLVQEVLRAPQGSPELRGLQVRLARLAEREAWARLAVADQQGQQGSAAQRADWDRLVLQARQERMAVMVQEVLRDRPVRQEPTQPR